MNEPSPIYILGLGLHRPIASEGAAGDASASLLPAAVLAGADVLVGGRLQLGRFPEHPAKKIPLAADVRTACEAVWSEARAGRRVVVLCGGDPLYFSFGGSLSGFLRQAGWTGELRPIPAISSLQAACAILTLPQQDVLSVSLHGRSSYLPLAHALLVVEGRREAAPRREAVARDASAEQQSVAAVAGDRRMPAGICILTDAANTPEKVAAFLIERGCTGYNLHVLDNLYTDAEGVARAERRQCLSLRQTLDRRAVDLPALPDDPLCRDASAGGGRAEKNDPSEGKGHSSPAGAYSPQRVIFLEPVPEQPKAGEHVFGLPDAAIQRERDLLTKQPVRAAGLAALGIAPHHVVWDLGSGSGAVAVEASRLAHQGRVIGVEEKAERVRDICGNRRLFKAANLEVVHARLPDALLGANAPDLSNADPLMERPHRIFIGGGLSGAGAEDLLRLAWERLLPGGRLVCHCVLLGSLETARRVLSALGARLSGMSLQAAQMRPLAGDVRFEGMNPVFLICAEKAADEEQEE